ncbi:hypothetical protein SH611_16990 [Geminicoccaceae bacterium 1502E]|nr:hypothetical protein [Geminicoccaceae bacterium 1502E]
MDIYGPSCERLVRAALEGPAAGPLLVGRHRFRLRQLEILKAPDGLGLGGGRGHHLSLYRGPLAVRRLAYQGRLASDGRMIELAVGDLAIDAALGRWLVAEGPLDRLAAPAGQHAACWPSDAPLGLLDSLGGWRGEAAFLLANVMIAACRRYLAPRAAPARPQPEPAREHDAAPAAPPAADAVVELLPRSPRWMAGAVHLAE